MAGDHLCTGWQVPDHVSSCQDGVDCIYRREKGVRDFEKGLPRSLPGILVRKILLVLV